MSVRDNPIIAAGEPVGDNPAPLTQQGLATPGSASAREGPSRLRCKARDGAQSAAARRHPVAMIQCKADGDAVPWSEAKRRDGLP